MTRTAVPAADLAVTLAVSAPAAAQSRAEDEYTRYELLAPETSSFKITFDLAAVTPGATRVLQRDPQRHPGDRPVGRST